MTLTTERREWLAAFYESHFRDVYRLCLALLRDREDAADAAQEVFIKAVHSSESESAPGVGRAWLLTVAKNHCLDLLRRRKRLGRALLTLGADQEAAADPEVATVDRDFVSAVFSELSPRERQALWQSAVERRPLADIADSLRLTYMAAAQVLHRARKHASSIAARVAAVLGLAHLRRHSSAQPLLAGHQAALLVLVPLVVVSLQSSTPAPQARAVLSPVPQSTSGPAVGNRSGPASGGLPDSGLAVPPLSVPAPSLSVPATVGPASTSAIWAAINTITGTIQQQPPNSGSLAPVTSALPSLPSALPVPSAVPIPSLVPTPQIPISP